MTTPKKAKPRPASTTARARATPRAGNDVPVPQSEKSFAAVIDQHSKSKRLAAQAEVFAGSILQQGETKDQPGRPQNQQEDERQRPEVAQKILAPRPRGDAAGECRDTGSRCAGRTSWSAGKTALHPARQHHGLERIQQDAKDGNNSGDGENNMHQAEIKM